MAIAWPIGAWLQALLPGLSLGWLHWAALASLPLTAVFVFIRVGPAVPGAMDNLSGIAIALAAFETLTPNGRSALAHTRLRFISFGSEEAGLRGAEAYVKAHKAQLHAENAVLINIDSVMNTDELKLITSEIMPMVAYDKPHLAAVKRAFAAAQAPFTTEPVPIGGTDAVCFQRAGIPSTTIIGFGTQGLHPAYHTRLDVPQYLDPQALDLVHDVLVAFAHQTDGPAAA
jgi:Zn-dependent M28 family amino/carboxypeptidase